MFKQIGLAKLDAVREASLTCDQAVYRHTARKQVRRSPSERMFIRAGDKEMRQFRKSYKKAVYVCRYRQATISHGGSIPPISTTSLLAMLGASRCRHHFVKPTLIVTCIAKCPAKLQRSGVTSLLAMLGASRCRHHFVKPTLIVTCIAKCPAKLQRSGVSFTCITAIFYKVKKMTATMLALRRISENVSRNIIERR